MKQAWLTLAHGFSTMRSMICELTYTKRMGFVDRGQDVENIISSLEWLLSYAAVVSVCYTATTTILAYR